jgi:hypothetical protein
MEGAGSTVYSLHIPHRYLSRRRWEIWLRESDEPIQRLAPLALIAPFRMSTGCCDMSIDTAGRRLEQFFCLAEAAPALCRAKIQGGLMCAERTDGAHSGGRTKGHMRIRSRGQHRRRFGRSFARLWVGFTFASTGDGLIYGAVPLLAVAVNPHPLAVSSVAAADTLPWLILALPAGAFADRFERGPVIALANVSRAAAGLLQSLAPQSSWRPGG